MKATFKIGVLIFAGAALVGCNPVRNASLETSPTTSRSTNAHAAYAAATGNGDPASGDTDQPIGYIGGSPPSFPFNPGNLGEGWTISSCNVKCATDVQDPLNLGDVAKLSDAQILAAVQAIVRANIADLQAAIQQMTSAGACQDQIAFEHALLAANQTLLDDLSDPQFQQTTIQLARADLPSAFLLVACPVLPAPGTPITPL